MPCSPARFSWVVGKYTRAMAAYPTSGSPSQSSRMSAAPAWPPNISWSWTPAAFSSRSRRAALVARSSSTAQHLTLSGSRATSLSWRSPWLCAPPHDGFTFLSEWLLSSIATKLSRATSVRCLGCQAPKQPHGQFLVQRVLAYQRPPNRVAYLLGS